MFNWKMFHLMILWIEAKIILCLAHALTKKKNLLFERGVKMKKAWSFISIGALASAAMMMYINNKSSVDKAMKNMKKTSKSAYNKVKAMFE